MGSPIRRKLLLTSLLLILVALGSADILLNRYTAARELERAQHELESQTRLLLPTLATTDSSTLADWTRRVAGESRSRVTLIDRNGVVMADSQYDFAAMDNHGGRPEVRQALAGQTGIAVRHSATLDVDLCYLAVPASLPGKPGVVLRLAVPLSQIHVAMVEIRWLILQASAIAMMAAA